MSVSPPFCNSKLLDAPLAESCIHQPTWLMCEAECVNRWHLITAEGWGKIRKEKKEAEWSPGGRLGLCQFPRRVVHLVLLCCSGCSVWKILSGHNYSAAAVKPLSAFMCCGLIVGNIMFPLLFTLFIWHPSSSLLDCCSAGQSGQCYNQFINIIHSINNRLNSNSTVCWLLILHVSSHHWRNTEPSMGVPRRGATPGTALKLGTPAHFMIGRQDIFFLSEQSDIGLTFSNYCLPYF